METEKRLIDAKELIRRICAERDEVQIKTGCDIGYHNGLNMAVSMAINAPTVDAVEVVHGRWDIDEFGVFCTVCKEYAEDDRRTTCCPECGAKMDGDGNG